MQEIISMNTSDRVYRPAMLSDLPQIQSGKLKVVYFYSDCDMRPCRFITAKYGRHSNPLFLYSSEDGSEHPAFFEAGLHVDVTPEKRYAIWNHKRQHFHSNSFTNKYDAEYWLKQEVSNNKDNFYIVEWEIKKDDV